MNTPLGPWVNIDLDDVDLDDVDLEFDSGPVGVPIDVLYPVQPLPQIKSSEGALRYQRINENARIERDPENAGYDVWNPHGHTQILPHQLTIVKIGLCFDIPTDYVLNFNTERSSIGKQQLIVLSGAIDWSYTGEATIFLYNLTSEMIVISEHKAIAQGILTYAPYLPLIEVPLITKKTQRGANGFGSTDKK